MHSENITMSCSICKIEQPIDNFNLDRSKPKGYRSECKSCKKEYRKSYYQNNKDKYKAYHYKNTYGISFDEYQTIISNGCEVCGSLDNLVVDHDHDTGLVRGCLCNGCNIAEGNLKGDIALMLNLIEYTKKHTKSYYE
jgi:hypothetical protein